MSLAQPSLYRYVQLKAPAERRAATGRSGGAKERAMMRLNLETLSGEQLLVLSVLHGRRLQPAIERELDRRALSGAATRPARSEHRTVPVASGSTQHAA